MSYQKDLDEYSDDELRKEIIRRDLLTQAGICSYCNRAGSESECKEKIRHEDARQVQLSLGRVPEGIVFKFSEDKKEQ